METLIWILTAIGLGAGLAMDACAVSMSNGLAEPKMKLGKIFTIAGFFWSIPNNNANLWIFSCNCLKCNSR